MQTRTDPTKLTGILFASGFVAALLVALSLLVPSLFSVSNSPTLLEFIGLLFYIWIVAAIVAVPIALLAGVPSYFFLTYLGAMNAPAVSFIGAACGLLVQFLLVHLTDIVNVSALGCTAIGLVSALFAWVLLNRKRPPTAPSLGTNNPLHYAPHKTGARRWARRLKVSTWGWRYRCGGWFVRLWIFGAVRIGC
jgi:hypothetical protein